MALAVAETRLYNGTESLKFYQNVSPSDKLRNASNQAEIFVQDYQVESSMRLDVFKAKAAAEKNIKTLGQWEKLSVEDQRLVEKMLLDGKRAGLALPHREREELVSLKKELNQVCMEFSVSLGTMLSINRFSL
jgi:Zn-dependent oligopeptidase